MSWLLIGAALAGVETATHDGRVVGERLRWTSELYGSGAVCAPVLPTDEVRHGRVDGGTACAYAGHLTVEREQVLGDLSPPLTPEGVHRITVKGSYATPDASLGLVKTVGGWTDPAVTRADRLQFDSNLRKHGPRRLGHAIYLRAPTAPTLPVSFSDTSISPVARVLMAGGLFGVLLIGVLVYRSLDRLARRERVDAWLNDGTVQQELQEGGIR